MAIMTVVCEDAINNDIFSPLFYLPHHSGWRGRYRGILVAWQPGQTVVLSATLTWFHEFHYKSCKTFTHLLFFSFFSFLSLVPLYCCSKVCQDTNHILLAVMTSNIPMVMATITHLIRAPENRVRQQFRAHLTYCNLSFSILVAIQVLSLYNYVYPLIWLKNYS